MNSRRVRVLPDEIANRIAAGEVVERPASVVKELVENAIDAGASRVGVAVDGAGKARIAVTDDGGGMGREDALLALERHATSKIRDLEDLEELHTLGFRGEALPSIASVSRLRLVTRTAEEVAGTELRVEAGRLVSVAASAAPPGTAVEVRDLFHSVPARRKFLKTDATELRAIVETVVQLALIHFEVGFELRSGNRNLLALPPGQSQEERAAEVIGAAAAGGLRWGREAAGGWEYALAYLPPHEGKGHRGGVRLFVNGRPVTDRLLFRALMEGYKGLLAPGRYPTAVLFLQVPCAEIDVNVHPAKREVRFRDEGQVFRWVAGSTARALAGPTGAERPLPAAEGDAPAGETPPEERAAEAGTGRVADALAAYAARAAAPEESLRRAWGREPAWRQPPRPAPAAPGQAAGGRQESTPRGRFGALRFVGSFDATYLIFEDVEGRDLVLIDQHAAHERILYERLLGDGSGQGARVQPLLFPRTVDCSAVEMAAFDERAPELAAMGFEVEPFGAGSLVVKGTPSGWPPGAEEAVIREVLGAEDAIQAAASGQERLAAAARAAACAGAVKARKGLVPSEAEELLASLEALRHPTHCPHGRPLLLRLGRSEIEGMFRRR